MEAIVRAIDVGFGNTKFVVGLGDGRTAEMRCACFPSRAYPSARDPSKAIGSEARKTFAIPIDGLFYEVGPDVMLAADAFRATEIHGDYIETPQYRALVRGALRMMRVDAVDLLVVGLPVAAFAAKKAALERLMTGRHDVGGGKTVTVHKALAMAQPHGALIDYATQHGAVEAMEHEQSLVIDPGSRTFDWLVAHGMRLSHTQSYSVERGVSNILQLIADDITHEIGQPYTNLDRIDWALRRGKCLTVYQQQYNPARMRPMVEIIAQDAVAAMMRRIGGSFNVQHVILAGGGAFLFKKAVRQAFSTHQIREIKEPMFANVRGYQVAGMNFAQSALGGGDASSRSSAPGSRA